MNLLRAKSFLPLSAIVMTLPSQAAVAAETVTHQYDALGRLVSSTTSGGPTSGMQVGTAYDPAGNRTSQSTSGAPATPPPPPTTCTFTAGDTEGNDEFSLYPYISRTGACSAPVTMTYTVQYVGGSGSYAVGPSYTGMTFQPSDTYKSMTIWPYYESVQAGSPLVLQVNWSIVSGTGLITDGTSMVTIYNSSCYC